MKTTILRDSSDGSHYVRILNKVFIDKETYTKIKSKLEHLEELLGKINETLDSPKDSDDIKNEITSHLKDYYGINQNSKD